jgi:hypothetical protein
VIIRRAFYWWLFPSAVVLPAWLLIGWAAFNQESGWSLLGLLILCPALFVAMLVVGGIVVARRGARLRKAVSWPIAGLLAGWHLSLIGFGFFVPGATGWFAVLAILFFLGLFWRALYEVVTETRTRVADTYAAYERAAQPHQVGQPEEAFVEDAEVIVVQERREQRPER